MIASVCEEIVSMKVVNLKKPWIYEVPKLSHFLLSFNPPGFYFYNNMCKTSPRQITTKSKSVFIQDNLGCQNIYYFLFYNFFDKTKVKPEYKFNRSWKNTLNSMMKKPLDILTLLF